MAKDDGIYVVQSKIDHSVAEVIKNQLKDLYLEEAQLDGYRVDTTYRKSKVSWLDTDNWIAGMMSNFINYANVNYFKYDLHAWGDKIQYTVYDGPGTEYKWHHDHMKSEYYDNMWRKLSISVCLEDNYTGGEFQLLTLHNKLKTFRMKCGDVLVFSSDTMHRVKPIKSGTRTSLVGWYAGPKFK